MAAGYVMLVDGMDSTWRHLVDNAASAESWDDVELAIEALKAESAWRAKQNEDATAEQRAKAGAPVHMKTMSSTALEAAVEDVRSWAGVPRSDPDEAGE